MGLIRILLSLSVVLGHYHGVFGFSMLSGAAPVQAFYVISGFYISLILNEKYQHTSIGNFYLTRYLRLAPILLLTALLTYFFITVPAYRESNPIVTSPLYISIPVILSQITLIGQDIFIFFIYDLKNAAFIFSSQINSPFPEGEFIRAYQLLQVQQGWSIGTEVWFYLIAPFMLRRSVWIIALIIFVSSMLRFYFYNVMGLHGDPFTYRFFPLELGTFLVGNLSYRVYEKLQNNYDAIGNRMVGVIATIIIFWSFIPKNDEKAGWLFVLIIGICLPFIFSATKSSKFDRWLGDLSYPIYVTHILVLFGLIRNINWIGEKWQSLFGVIATLVVSILMVYVIDKPVDKIRQRIAKQS